MGLLTRAELDALALKARDLGEFMRRMDNVRQGTRAASTYERNVAQSICAPFFDWSRFYDLARTLIAVEAYR